MLQSLPSKQEAEKQQGNKPILAGREGAQGDNTLYMTHSHNKQRIRSVVERQEVSSSCEETHGWADDRSADTGNVYLLILLAVPVVHDRHKIINNSIQLISQNISF